MGSYGRVERLLTPPVEEFAATVWSLVQTGMTMMWIGRVIACLRQALPSVLGDDQTVMAPQVHRVFHPNGR